MIKYRCTNSKKFISQRTTCRLLKKCNFLHDSRIYFYSRFIKIL